MKKILSSKQLEEMIAQCVGQVLSESRQNNRQKPQSNVLNESQLQNYIQNIINEEIEKEGITGRAWGGLKGGVQGLLGLRQKHKLDQENMKSDNPNKKTVANNRTSNFYKIKQTMANQAADSDRNQEFSKLINRLEKLQLNNYFDSREDIYNLVDELIDKLKYFMSYQEYQTQGQYKRNFGVTHPDKNKPQQSSSSNGMNTGYRSDRGKYIMGRS